MLTYTPTPQALINMISEGRIEEAEDFWRRVIVHKFNEQYIRPTPEIAKIFVRGVKNILDGGGGDEAAKTLKILVEVGKFEVLADDNRTWVNPYKEL